VLRMRLRHQLSKESIFLDKVAVTDHVTAPYRYIGGAWFQAIYWIAIYSDPAQTLLPELG